MSPAQRRTFVLLARFLLLGLLAFGAKRLLFGGARAPRPLTVEVALDASPAQIEQALEDAMLLDVAERAGLPQHDAVVRERILRSLGVVEDVSDGNAAVTRGVELGVHRQDVVARERLLSDARELLFAGRARTRPADAEVLLFIAANASQYAAPPRVRFRQLFLSRERRGGSLASDAAKLGERLASHGEAAASDLALAVDPWPWTNPGSHYHQARLDALAGSGFGAAVMAAPMKAWSGPIESSFGIHFVWVTELTPASAAPLSIALPRARADIAVRDRERAAKERLRALRGDYVVSWVRRP